MDTPQIHVIGTDSENKEQLTGATKVSSVMHPVARSGDRFQGRKT